MKTGTAIRWTEPGDITREGVVWSRGPGPSEWWCTYIGDGQRHFALIREPSQRAKDAGKIAERVDVGNATTAKRERRQRWRKH